MAAIDTAVGGSQNAHEKEDFNDLAYGNHPAPAAAQFRR